NGRQALDWLADHQPELVLLDIMMPDISGFAVLRELRETGGQMPVVMITAFGDAAAEASSSEAGAQSLLRTPLRPRELLDHIHRLLHPPE
ncbi:MAG: response regulator, partial [Chloroflexi bacterium]|nr:response regulator [Chloroflexota bacterium]